MRQETTPTAPERPSPGPAPAHPPERQDLDELLEQARQEVLAQACADRQHIKAKKDKTVLKNLPLILATALKVANQKGFQAMSMRDLGRATGMSMGTLYAYFESKEELLELLQRTGRQITSRVLAQAVAKAGGPRQQLKAAIRAHLYLSEAMQDWFYFSYMEARHLGPEEKERAKASELATEKVFHDILVEGVRQGVFNGRDTRLLASALKAMLQDWYVKRPKHQRRRLGVERYARFLCDLVETYCLARGPEERGPARPEA